MPSDTTTKLALPYIAAAQAQKHVTHNEALRALDAIAQIGVLDKDLATPPGAPDEGDSYVVPAGATGAWAGHGGKVAAFQDGAWAFYGPKTGWLAWVADETSLYVFDGSAWTAPGSGGGGSINPAPLVGVNTTADSTNRLAVKSDAVLFSHDDVTPGNGDIRVVYNKASAADTASFIFQDNSSGRAEIGLTGDDNIHFKVSSDGSAWTEALHLDRSNGQAYGREGGVIPSVMMSMLTANLARANNASAQAWFDTSADAFTLAASTSYFFDGVLSLSRTAGTTSHNTSLLFGGTAALTSIGYLAQVTNPTGNALANVQQIWGTVDTAVQLTTANTVATENLHVSVRGIVRCDTAGTFIPQFQYNNAPGGAPTARANSYFRMYPVGSDTVAAVGPVG
jgi:hypothetical protein